MKCAADYNCGRELICTVIWQRGVQTGQTLAFCEKHYCENLKLRPDIMDGYRSLKTAEEVEAEFWEEFNS